MPRLARHPQTVPPVHGQCYMRAVVAQATEKIEALIQRLEATGAEPRRLDALRCTQRFKKSWVDLAEMLVGLRRDKSYEAWGYEDFHQYCASELHLRRATVDKLTISFSTLKRLAPSVLKWDGVEREVPSISAVDYFGKAVDAANAPPQGPKPKQPPREVIKELRHAVFDEGQSVAELRKRFDPILRPKPQGHRGARGHDAPRRWAAARKLADLLPEIEGLEDDKRVVPGRKGAGQAPRSPRGRWPSRCAPPFKTQKKAARPKAQKAPKQAPAASRRRGVSEE